METRFMALQLPTIGTDVNYWEEMIYNYNRIDLHDHSTLGNTISEGGIEWKLLDITGYSFLDTQRCFFTNQTDKKLASLYVKSGNLFYTDALDREIQITQNGGLDYTATIAGFFGDFNNYDASVVFSSAQNGTYTFSGGAEGTTVYAKTTNLTKESTTKNLVCTFPVTVDFQSKVPKTSTYFGPGFTDFVYFDRDGLISYQNSSLNVPNILKDTFLVDNANNLVTYVNCNNPVRISNFNYPPGGNQIRFSCSSGTIINSVYNKSIQNFLISKSNALPQYPRNHVAIMYAEVQPLFNVNSDYGLVEWIIFDNNIFSPLINIGAFCLNHCVVAYNKNKIYKIVDYYEMTYGTVVPKVSVSSFYKSYGGIFKTKVEDDDGNIVKDYVVAISAFVYTDQAL